MAHSKTYDAFVLHTYDVGEADRFCILLTKQRGKIAARARGVRKINSRMGGSLLPYNEVTLQLHETGGNFLITSALQKHRYLFASIQTLLEVQQGIELLLALLHDDEPLPEVYAAVCDFLQYAKQAETVHTPAFEVRLLHLLGILPSLEHSPYYQAMDTSMHNFVALCTSHSWHKALSYTHDSCSKLHRLCQNIVQEHSHRSLKVGMFSV